MTKARVPHVALVLLPAALLAAVGVRAVTAEMRASEDAARERARSVASRLARSVDALVAEYAGALPKAGTSLTRAQAKEMTAHLQPRRALTLDGVSLALDHDLPPDPGPIPEDEASLVEDALQRAKGLAREPDGAIAAEALASTMASVVTHPVAKARLLYAAAEYEVEMSRGDCPLATLDAAISAGAWLRDTDGTPFDVRGAQIARHAAQLGANAKGLAVGELHARLAEDVWGGGYAEDSFTQLAIRGYRGASSPEIWVYTPGLEEAWMAALPDGAIAFRAGWSDARRHAAWLRADPPRQPPTAVLVGVREHGGAALSVWTVVQIDGRPALLGGDVPAVTLNSRMETEIRALTDEVPVAEVSVRAQSGAVAFDGRNGVNRARDVVMEAVPLADPLSEWRAQAVVTREGGIPPTAWFLGAAVVVTTAALVAGMLALRRSAERSARLAEDRQTFLDHVAHELRTPAAAVQALTEELASGHVTKEREAAYREHLLRESRRLSALVEDTLDLTRLDAGRLAFKMEPADLRDVVRRAVEESDGAGRVTASLPDAPVVRAVDEGTLRRAVRNLVENAIRHGGDGAPVRVTLEASNGAAAVTVADQGRGIAEEHQARLFERFYRVPSATHEVKGVGLGLALCREVARAHGGDVTVASEVGKGSTFTLRIPLA